jgi:hypothetical protein
MRRRSHCASLPDCTGILSAHARHVLHHSAPTPNAQDFEAGRDAPSACAAAARLFDERTYGMLHQFGLLNTGSQCQIPNAAVGTSTSAAPGPSSGDVGSIEDIYKFISRAFKLAQFSPECILISLVLLNRLIATTKLPLTPTNWRPLVLTSLLVAQKVWDDSALANIDFPTVWNHALDGGSHGVLDVRAVNQLERKFLELLQVRCQSFFDARYGA